MDFYTFYHTDVVLSIADIRIMDIYCPIRYLVSTISKISATIIRFL